MVSTHILEVFNCLSAVSRDQYRKDLISAGATIVDEKIIYQHNHIKFYLTLNQINKHTEETFLGKLKAKSPTWDNSVCLTRICRGTDKKVNVLGKT